MGTREAYPEAAWLPGTAAGAADRGSDHRSPVSSHPVADFEAAAAHVPASHPLSAFEEAAEGGAVRAILLGSCLSAMNNPSSYM